MTCTKTNQLCFSGDQCGHKGNYDNFMFNCTRKKDHEGPHIACGDVFYLYGAKNYTERLHNINIW